MDAASLPRPVRPSGLPRPRRAGGVSLTRPVRLGLAWAAVCVLCLSSLSLPGAAGAIARSSGGTGFVAHVYPVDGSHWTRGAIGEFGAPRVDGRTHEGFDIVAACRTPLVAAASGRVLRTGFDPVLYGNFLLIHGAGEHRSYFYAHMRRPARVRRGERVFAGERVGAVGETGNARTVGCHLHLEIHVHGRPVDPRPIVSRW